MQGSVWGSIFCTTSIDKLGQIAYENEDLLYMYKGQVAVPPISMVDDILCITKCSDSAKINATVNAFVEMKKLTLSKSKCNRIHIGKNVEPCPELKTHNEKMKDSSQEKYLGDFVNSTGNVKATVADRIGKGYGIVSEIRAILNEIPLGRYKLEIGLQLRQAMLINGLLYNSEAWHSVTQEDIRGFEKVDESLLRFLLGSHPKAPLEMLYLESGATPIRYVLTSRRMNYFHTIIRREDEELTKRILKAQMEDPCPGDFIKLIEEDCKKIGIPFETEFVENSSPEFYKKFIKSKVKEAAFQYLTKLQKTHSKVKDIKFEKLEIQKYLTSPVFSNCETKLLFALRSRTLEGIRANFPNMYKENLNCPLNCWSQDEQIQKDTQQHILVCPTISSKFKSAETSFGAIRYEDIFSDVHKQKEVTALIGQLLDVREDCLPGAHLDPSTSLGSCCDDALCTCCVLNVLSCGK